MDRLPRILLQGKTASLCFTTGRWVFCYLIRLCYGTVSVQSFPYSRFIGKTQQQAEYFTDSNDRFSFWKQISFVADGSFSQRHRWQCWHYCQLCILIYLPISSLFASTDVGKFEIRNQGASLAYMLYWTCFFLMVQLKQSWLRWLSCMRGEFVKNSIVRKLNPMPLVLLFLPFRVIIEEKSGCLDRKTALSLELLQIYLVFTSTLGQHRKRDCNLNIIHEIQNGDNKKFASSEH